jgi:hypothetical protein
MSVIYRTLKKLKAEAAGNSAWQQPSYQRGGIAGKVRVTSPIVVSLLVTAVLSGFFASYVIFSHSGSEVNNSGRMRMMPIAKEETNRQDPSIGNEQDNMAETLYYPPKPKIITMAGLDSTLDISALKKADEQKIKLPPARVEKGVQVDPSEPIVEMDVPEEKEIDFAGSMNTPSENSDIHVAKENKIRVSKSIRISEIVTRIHRSMEGGDKEIVEKALTELAQLKGEEDDFVVKMKAYWYIQNRQNDAAASLLGKILAKDSNDLEAGINMAIVDLRTNKNQSAYERLAKLQKTNPDNIQVAELMQEMKTLR